MPYGGARPRVKPRVYARVRGSNEYGLTSSYPLIGMASYNPCVRTMYTQNRDEEAERHSLKVRTLARTLRSPCGAMRVGHLRSFSRVLRPSHSIFLTTLTWRVDDRAGCKLFPGVDVAKVAVQSRRALRVHIVWVDGIICFPRPAMARKASIEAESSSSPTRVWRPYSKRLALHQGRW